MGEGPDIPLHVRCRCVSTPILKTYRELGIDIDEMEEVARPYTMRPDENIDAGGRRTIQEVGLSQGDYGSWFDKQSREFKLKAMGPGRLELLENGDVTFQGLVDSKTGELKTLKELRGGRVSGYKGGAAVTTASFSWKGLDKVGLERYIDNDGKLRDALKATVDERKLTEYALNLESPDGKNKAYVFRSALGITIDDADDVRRQIFEGVNKHKASYAGDTRHGSRFTVYMPIKGPKGKAVVKTAWLQDKNDELRLTSVMVADEKEQALYKHLIDDGE